MIKKITQKLVYQDKWLKLYQDEIEFPDGSKGTYAWADRKSGVGIVVITKDKKILLHKEYRYPVRKYSWEIQGGGVDEGETLEQAGVRELREESGIEVHESDLVPLGAYYPLHSFSTERGPLFMVIIDQTTVNTFHSEQSEIITDQRFFTFDEVYQMIDSGTINSAATANAVQLAMRRFGR